MGGVVGARCGWGGWGLPLSSLDGGTIDAAMYSLCMSWTAAPSVGCCRCLHAHQTTITEHRAWCSTSCPQVWVGLDISAAMLDVAHEREVRPGEGRREAGEEGGGGREGESKARTQSV